MKSVVAAAGCGKEGVPVFQRGKGGREKAGYPYVAEDEYERSSDATTISTRTRNADSARVDKSNKVQKH